MILISVSYDHLIDEVRPVSVEDVCCHNRCRGVVSAINDRPLPFDLVSDGNRVAASLAVDL